jgi:tetratricopeptide (TPR) repeat protein
VLATASDEVFRDANQAVRLAERAATLTERRNAEVLDALAAAYAVQGQFERALEAVGEAIRLDPSAAVAAGMLERQALYRKGQPYRQPARVAPARTR